MFKRKETKDDVKTLIVHICVRRHSVKWELFPCAREPLSAFLTILNFAIKSGMG